MKKLIVLLLVLLMVPTVSAQDEQTTLRIGTVYILDTLNPTAGFYGYDRRPLWHDTLIEWGGGDTFAPAMAESWTVSDDGLEWDFKIREGLEFSDGTPITAEDVAWSLNWTVNNDISAVAASINGLESIEAVEDNTVRFVLTEPVTNMISAKLIFLWILPRQVWDGLSEDEITTFDGIESTLGSGPYKVTDFQEGEYLILEAVENHWRGEAPVERIIYQEYATEDALVQALLAGEIDLIENAVPFSGVAPIEDEVNITLSIANGFSFEELIINSSPDGTQPASLNDPIVREAIAQAIDKEQIATIAYLGYAEPANTFLMPTIGALYNSEIPNPAYDLDAANQILDDAGYVDADGDGIREYSDGSSLFYRLYTPDSEAYYARILDIISDDLASIGIGTDVQILSDETLIDLQPDYDNDLIYWGWNWDPDPDFALSVFTCAETEDYGWSDSGYCNEAYDALYDQQDSLATEAERQDVVWQMQQMIYDAKPYIPVVYVKEIGAYRNDHLSLPEDFAGRPIKWWLYNGFSLAE